MTASDPGTSGAVRASVGTASRLDDDPSLRVGRAGDGLTVDGRPVAARLVVLDDVHATLIGGLGDGDVPRTPVLFGPVARRRVDHVLEREVVVGGWRIVVEVEPDARASLRERARRGGGAALAGGPVDVRAIIPGRIVALDVAPGDGVTAGQQMLVLEAMKMQNELRAPRDGTIERVAVAVGDTVEVGDLLLVLR